MRTMTPYPLFLFQWYLQSNEILLNLNIKWWNSAFNAQGWRVIIVVVEGCTISTPIGGKYVEIQSHIEPWSELHKDLYDKVAYHQTNNSGSCWKWVGYSCHRPCKGCVHSVYPKAILDVQYKANRGRVKMKGRVLDHQPTTQNNVDTYLHVQTLFIYLFIFKIIYYFGDLSLPWPFLFWIRSFLK
jgi:hypothetical protein